MAKRINQRTVISTSRTLYLGAANTAISLLLYYPRPPSTTCKIRYICKWSNWLMCGIAVFIGNVVLPNYKILASLFKYFNTSILQYITQPTPTMSKERPCEPLMRLVEDGTRPHPPAKGSTDVYTSHALAQDPSLFPPSLARCGAPTQTGDRAPSPVSTFLEDCSSLLRSAATGPG